MHKVRRLANKGTLLHDERGLSTVEYVILLVIVAVLSISLWQAFGTKLREQLTNSTSELEKIGDRDATGSDTAHD
jgi:Flp pilus assembly pilin Flp